MKTGGRLYDYTPEQINELRASRVANADRRAQGARGVASAGTGRRRDEALELDNARS